MTDKDSKLQRYAAYATILSLPIGILAMVVSVVGLWVSYIQLFPPSSAKPPDMPGAGSGDSELSYINDKYLGLDRFWGDDLIGQAFEGFFDRPYLWIPAAVTFFVLTIKLGKRDKQ